MKSPKQPKSFLPAQTLTIRPKVNDPNLLEGLDAWVKLGLISDQWVRENCQQYLSCAVTLSDCLPVESQVSAATASASPAVITAKAKPTFVAATASTKASPPKPPLIPRLTQAVMDNFSITWLLFLGVFLVVLSSVVLAASKWQTVSPPGQYSILFLYTLAFWGVGTWTQRQANLRLTSRMLRIATLLIIPINFWMIDGLGLWSSVLGWGIGIIAAIALSAMILALVQTKSSTSFLAAVNTIALSGLHWGWDIPPMPLIATYVGTVGTALLVSRYQVTYFKGRKEKPKVDDGVEDADQPEASLERDGVPLGLIAIAFATFLLVIRAVTVGQVPWSQLGLAIGLCGWVLSWISRTPTHTGGDLWLKGGAKLLLLGWLVSVNANPPWQALIVSGLGLWLLGDRLLRHWRSIDLIALFMVGLQLLWLMERLVPGIWRDYLLDLCIRLSGNQGMPTALVGLTLFPYVWVMLAGGQYLRQRQKQRLSRQADWMALGLGSCLTIISLSNPMTRSLSLLASTITVGIVRRQAHHHQSIVPFEESTEESTQPSTKKSTEKALIWAYSIHSLSLATLLSWIELLMPTLTPIQWGVILVILTGFEWGIYSHLAVSASQQTTWIIGLGLGAIAYGLFLTDPYNPLCTAWLLVPPMLIYVGHRSLKARPILRQTNQTDSSSRPAQASQKQASKTQSITKFITSPHLIFQSTDIQFSPQLAGWLSTLALIAGQPLLFNIDGANGWIFGFNALTLFLGVPLTRSLWTASLSLGSAVLGLWVTTYQLGFDNQQLYLWSFTPGLLWVLRSLLHCQSSLMATLYRRASNGWAIAITTILLLGGNIYTFLLYASFVSPKDAWQAAIASVLLLCSLLYRSLNRSSLSIWGREWTYLGIAWITGLLTAQLNSSLHGTATTLGSALLSLGLISQLLLPNQKQAERQKTGKKAEGRRQKAKEPTPSPSQEGNRPNSPTLQLSNSPTPSLPHSLTPQPSKIHNPQSKIQNSPTLLIPLFYGILGWSLSQIPFTASTGLYTLAFAFIAIGIGRRNPRWKALTILAAGIITMAAYQLLIYQMQQASEGKSGDGLMILAGLGLGLTIFYGVGAWGRFKPWFQTYLQLSINDVSAIGHCHWFLSTGLGVLAVISPRSLLGDGLGSITFLALAAYALAWGRQRSPEWTFVGIWQLIGAIAFTLYSFVPSDAVVTWGGAIASCVAFILYKLPWQRWGWPPKPWAQSTLVLPSIVMVLTAQDTNIPSILIVAAFYAWLAKSTGRIRISYLSIGFISWALLWFISLQDWTRLLWVSLDVGGAILYIAEVDPALSNHADSRQTRHILRTLATGLICFASVYQSESSPWTAVFTLGFSLVLIAVGIQLKTRAYLFVGTGTLLFEVLRYTRQFIGQHPLQIWAVGIFLGLALIWIAATFEARRNQVQSAFNHWQTELASWK
ncbi:MAG: hypothetical protein AAGD25_11655 [Cyanobacteria bacterium P01_F01_bin.150]